MVAVIANVLRAGNIIDHNNGLWRIVSTEHVKPGKGGAFIQAVMKNVKTGAKLDHRFRSDESVEKARFELITANFMFSSDDDVAFMTTDTFEQIDVKKELLGNSFCFLNQEIEVGLERIEEEIVGVVFPDTVVLQVMETQPKMKSQTVTATLKPAIMNNGITVQVPQFIVEGDKIRVKTLDHSYSEKI